MTFYPTSAPKLLLVRQRTTCSREPAKPTINFPLFIIPHAKNDLYSSMTRIVDLINLATTSCKLVHRGKSPIGHEARVSFTLMLVTENVIDKYKKKK